MSRFSTLLKTQLSNRYSPIRQSLNQFGLQHYYLLQSVRNKTTRTHQPILFTPVGDFDKKSAIFEIAQKDLISNSKKILLRDDNHIKYFTADDIGEKSKFNSIIVGSVDDISVYYGREGVMPRQGENENDILINKLQITGGQTGVLSIARQVPFRIECSKQSALLSFGDIKNFPTYEENIQRCSCYTLNTTPFDSKVSKSIAAKLRERIHCDLNNEPFGKETTLPVYKPDESNKSSATLMDFDERDGEYSTSDIHYHPGERVLYIFTTNTPSGVSINMCGINENPDDRKDCEIHFDFAPNSFIMLVMPPLVWHKFNGSFVSSSNHSREGDRFIDMIKEGNVSGNFLELTTTFIDSLDNKEGKWSNDGLVSNVKSSESIVGVR